MAPYLQLVRQVRQALRLGLLAEGDQLPTVKEVVAKVAINPNTVLKAYRELELEGLVAARQLGLGFRVDRQVRIVVERAFDLRGGTGANRPENPLRRCDCSG